MSVLGFQFRERMEGTVQRADERRPRRFRFDLEVRAPSLLGFATTTIGLAQGTVHLDGLATEVPARGHLEISPWHRHLIRYVVEFKADDGHAYRFDGEKDTGARRRLVGWTTLPGKVYDDVDGRVWGEALLRFSLRRELGTLLKSVRVGRGPYEARLLGPGPSI